MPSWLERVLRHTAKNLPMLRSKATPAQWEQRVAEELFGLAVNASPNGMIMIDQSGQIVMVNDEIENLFGHKRDDLLGRPVEMLVPEELRAEQNILLKNFVLNPSSGGNSKVRERLGLRKDGTRFSAETNLNSVRTKGGMLILASIVDVSERNKTQQIKDEFVSTVSHELRTPLTSLTASLALLSAGRVGPLSEAATRLVSIAHSNGQRLVRLVNDILDIEKIDSGKMALAITQVVARDVVMQAVEMSRAYAEEFGVKVLIADDSVPGEVRADADRLAQVVSNLLSNAIKFSPRENEVVIGIAERDGKIRVTVHDCGAGIPESFKPRVFERFSQADGSDARPKGGTGLGLSIVKEIVNRFGGEVGFESGTGQGTSFFVDLLRWDSVVDADTKATLRDDRIMLCEDDSDVASLLAAKLGKAGFEALVAATVSEALSNADRANYAAVLVDLNLPDGDGIGLIQELRARPRYHDKPIVVISANSKRGRDDLRAAALGVLDWLDKPVDIHQLVELLRHSMDANAVRNGRECCSYRRAKGERG